MSGTNFHNYSHGQMRSMLDSMDSGAIMAASDPWRNATTTLKEIQNALKTASADAVSSWDGTTSTAFHGTMTKLAASVNEAAAYSNDAANAMELASKAIDEAKRTMPEEPSFWDKAGDAISDTAKGAVGVEDEDTRTTVTDARKAEAVAVMQTLAVKFTAAKNSMKLPGVSIDHYPPEVSPHDPSGAEMVGAMIMGGGMGFVGGNRTSGVSGSTSRAAGPSGRVSPQAPKVIGAGGPRDSGITGSIANPAPKPKGPSTGIDGTHVGGGTSTLPGSNTGNHQTGPGGLHGGSGGGQGTGGGLGPTTSGGGSSTTGVKGGGGIGSNAGRGGIGSNSGRGGLGSSAARAGTFGAGGMGEGHGAGGTGARSGGGAGRSGLVSKAGGVVGEANGGRAGGRSFSEGGSGIGRSRGGQAGQGAGGQGHGGPGQGQASKKDKKKGKDRPDYLVEDEETWATGGQVNPDVVE